MSIAPGQIWKIDQADGSPSIRMIRRTVSSLRGAVHNIDFNSLGIVVASAGLRHEYVVCGSGTLWLCLTPTIDERMDQ